MIGHTDEYVKMYAVERELWWYRHLHERVVAALRQRFGARRDIRILDAGCGTGGLLDYLRAQGYDRLTGIDGSADAVAFCHERGLDVSLLNLNDLADWPAQLPFDAIICNDVFCYFDDAGLTRLLANFGARLAADGLLISNNNAFGVFKGQHDLAVGSSRRFVRADLARLLPRAGLALQTSTYWSLLLSPLILAMRQWQQLELRLGKRAPETARSDVYLPAPWVNQTLYRLVTFENRWLPRTPFGSSLFITGRPIPRP